MKLLGITELNSVFSYAYKNKRSELISKSRHKRKFKLKNLEHI